MSEADDNECWIDEWLAKDQLQRTRYTQMKKKFDFLSAKYLY